MTKQLGIRHTPERRRAWDQAALNAGKKTSIWAGEVLDKASSDVYVKAPVLGEMIEGRKRRRMTVKDIKPPDMDISKRYCSDCRMPVPDCVCQDAARIEERPSNPKLEGVDEVCPIGVNPRAIAAEREKQKKLAEQGKGEA